MGVMDWVNVDAVAHHKTLPWWQGSLSCTVGDALVGILGSRSVNILGPDYKVLLDLESLLGQIPAIGPAIEAVGTLVSGMTGNVSFTYGGGYKFDYGGPQAVVRRGAAWSKTSNSLFNAPYDFKGPGGGAPLLAQPADKAVDAAVGSLSALMLCTILGMYIGIKIEQSKLAAIDADTTKTDEEKKSESETPQQTLEILVVVSKVVAPRLMAVIKLLEHACTIADFGREFAKVFWPITSIACLLGALGIITGVLVSVLTLVPLAVEIGIIKALGKDVSDVVDDTVDAIGACLSKARELVTEAAA